MDTFTVITWNLQGSHGVDVDLVVSTIERSGADVAVLQEIQRRQCRRLADRLRWPARWAFKHWPVVSRPEGMAVLTPHQLGHARAFVVQRAAPWSWQRRIALDAVVVVDGRPWRTIDVHLSPHEQHVWRTQEVERILERTRLVAPIIAGDLNDRPDGPAARMLTDGGWQDAWATRHGEPGSGADGAPDPGATNWTPGSRAGRPPTQRLDVVFVPAGWVVEAAEVVVDPLDALSAVSDHLPVVATVRRPSA